MGLGTGCDHRCPDDVLPSTMMAFSQVFTLLAFFLLAAPLTHGSGETLCPPPGPGRAVDVRHGLPFDVPAVFARVDVTGVSIGGEEFPLSTMGSDCAEAVAQARALHGPETPIALDVSPATPAWVVLTVMRECERTTRPLWLVVRS